MEFNSLTVLIIIGILAVIIIGFVFGIFLLLNPKRTSADRLDELTGQNRKTRNDAVKEAIANRLSKLAQSQDEDERNLLKIKLMQAGYRDPRAADIFNVVRVALLVVCPLLISPFLAFQDSLPVLLIGVVVTAIVGYMLPNFIVNSNIQSRQKKLLHPFPDALDLLVTSVEAGLGVDAAFRRVSTELESAAPELALEFQLVNHEISTGVARVTALKRLAQRTGLEEIKALVNMLTQAERFGTSIARAIRIHSDLTRQKRMAKAEEAAAKVSPKLTVVMILFLLPCLVIVLLGPAVVKIKKIFFAE